MKLHWTKAVRRVLALTMAALSSRRKIFVKIVKTLYNSKALWYNAFSPDKSFETVSLR